MLFLSLVKAGTGNMGCLSSWLIIKEIMNKNIPDFSGLPTDNSSSTNLKYDIISSKFMSGIENHNRNNLPVPLFSASFGLIGAVLQLFVAIVILLGLALRWIWKQF